MNLASEVWLRLLPTSRIDLDDQTLLVLLVVSGLIITVQPLWKLARLGVTLVHELGHAVVGVLCGRAFTGLVLRWDASGHAVTRGRSNGVGRILTTWAGYPAPALVGAGLITAAIHGWAPPLLALTALVMVGALIRVRSLLTAAVLLVSLLSVAALWWFGDGDRQGSLLLVAGLVCLVGAWRHVASVIRSPSRDSDPAVLAKLTKVPKSVWNISFILMCALSSWFTFVQVQFLWQP